MPIASSLLPGFQATFAFDFFAKANQAQRTNNKELIIPVSAINLAGKHNLQNICASIAVAKLLGINNKKIKKVLATFNGLKHRLQLVKKVKSVKFYNDSYSTIPETTIAAIQSIDGPKILILGGSSKKSDFSQLAKVIVRDKKIKSIILIGTEAKKIKHAIHSQGRYSGKLIEGLNNMQSIVASAFKSATKGDSVILSPACASFDMFNSYEDRGQQFIDHNTIRFTVNIFHHHLILICDYTF